MLTRQSLWAGGWVSHAITKMENRQRSKLKGGFPRLNMNAEQTDYPGKWGFGVKLIVGLADHSGAIGIGGGSRRKNTTVGAISDLPFVRATRQRSIVPRFKVSVPRKRRSED